MTKPQPVMIERIKAYASRCHTPRQFNKLIDDLTRLFGRDKTRVLPIVCGWGYPNIKSTNTDETVEFDPEIVCIKNMGFPKPYLNWFRTSGMLTKDPVFMEWLKTGSPQIWSEVAKRRPDAFVKALITKVKDYNLRFQLEGGWISDSPCPPGVEGGAPPQRGARAIAFFSIALGSEAECHNYLGAFSELLPSLGLALKNSHSTPCITPRRLMILKHIALGSSHKEIAHALKISESAVKDHRTKILRALSAENDANAVLIALVEKVIKPSLYF
jgi:DNA-binding CsgD family transcriptional regulator